MVAGSLDVKSDALGPLLLMPGSSARTKVWNGPETKKKE